ncbi:hypothetical protein F4778DRAFT_244541 [Xylariomycetidae sp. FL2044]|nr:hypothetical protein F4778DRAFT_244541 [Xylariomycetidae sp. FL2044]
MPLAISTTIITSVAVAQPSIIARQVVLTQTITNLGGTTTAVVTLDRGSPPTDAPPPPSHGSTDSDGLTQAQIGIIVGCCLGAVLVALIVWLCCIVTRRRRAYRLYLEAYLDEMGEFTSAASMITIPPPRRSYWPPFPRSIPPPPFPSYRARVPPQRYTSHDYARRASTTYVSG